MNPFLASVIESETFSSNKSFSKEISFSDRNHSADTVITAANSDFAFAG